MDVFIDGDDFEYPGPLVLGLALALQLEADRLVPLRAVLLLLVLHLLELVLDLVLDQLLLLVLVVVDLHVA